MIRTLWVAAVLGAATLLYGLIAIGASLLRHRGGVYTWATREWARSVLWASNTPVTVRGLEHIRRDEAQVVVSNHVSWYDVFAIASALPGEFHFVAKKELERILFFGTAWKAAGHISLDRSDRQRALLSLRQAGEKIRRDKGTVIVFPEGTRSRTGDLQPFKKGAFMLAVEAQAAVIPTVVLGSYEIMRPDTWQIRPHPLRVHFGAPVPTAGLESNAVDSLVAEVRSRMEAMFGEAAAGVRLDAR